MKNLKNQSTDDVPATFDSLNFAALSKLEVLRKSNVSALNRLIPRIFECVDGHFVPPVITSRREVEAAPLVAEISEMIKAVWAMGGGAPGKFKARLTRALGDIENQRAISLVPHVGSHPAHQRYFAALLRSERLEAPDPIEPGKFYPLNRIIARHGDSSAGWCMWFKDDSGGAYGHGRDASGLTFYRTPGEKTQAENTRFRQNIDAAHAALSADRQARRR